MTLSIVRTFRRGALVASYVVALLFPSIGRTEAPSAGSDELFQRLDADDNSSIAAAEVPTRHKNLFERLLRKADINRDRSLSREEFLAGLVPTRPEKKLEEKQPDGYPQADAIRYVLLTMDTRKDSWIEADEVPDDMAAVYDTLIDRLDVNNNGSMDRYELSRGGRELGQIAARYVAREGINVAKELKKLDKAQGDLAQRFDRPPGSVFATLADPGKARTAYKQFDANGDGKLVLEELPEPVQRQFERFMRIADRDGNGGLSEREFLTAAERMSRAMARQRPQMNDPNSKTGRQARRRANLPAGVVQADEMADESMPAEAMSAEDE